MRDLFPKIVGLFLPGDPEPGPYDVFTTRFDRAVTSDQLSDAINEPEPEQAETTERRWPECLALAQRWETAEAETGAHIRALAAEPVAVTLLVDQSGSLRDDKIIRVAAAVRLAARALQDAGAETEVLGFTTIGWHGGQSRKAWRAAGQPKRPGRLCDLLHIIYAAAGEPWSDERLKPMLRPDLLRENVDGEALLWALKRIRTSGRPRKIIVVVSDGAPVDDATLLANDDSILWRHLQAVLKQLHADADVELVAVGVGVDVSDWYPRSEAVIDLEQLGPLLLGVIEDALAAGRPKNRD